MRLSVLEIKHGLGFFKNWALVVFVSPPFTVCVLFLCQSVHNWLYLRECCSNDGLVLLFWRYFKFWIRGFKLKSEVASAMLPFSALLVCTHAWGSSRFCLALLVLSLAWSSFGVKEIMWEVIFRLKPPDFSQFCENKLLCGASDDIRWSANSSWLSTNSPAGYHLRNEVRQMTLFGWPKY